MPNNFLREAAEEIALAERVTLGLEHIPERVGAIANDNLAISKSEKSNQWHIRVLPHPFDV